MGFMGRAMCVVAAVVLCAAATGCEGLATAERFRADAAGLRDHLREEARQWDQRVAALGPGHPLLADAQAALAATSARLAAVEAAIARVDLVIEEARNPRDMLTEGARAVAPLLPEPIRAPLLLGAALVVTLGRAAQLKRAMISTARSIEKAMEDDEQFSEVFRRHANTFRTIQTAAAKRIVDEATDEGFKIRLAI